MKYKEREPMYEQVLGKQSAFHNPYTFIPFPDSNQAPRRAEPTPLTADEDAPAARYTGVLELEVTTTSPLLTSESEPILTNEVTGHKQYRALTIGQDVIVPASGVRGSLRSLLTILVGGTLGYLDEDLHLCQGRDLQMVMPGMPNPTEKPVAVLARVVRPGSAFGAGRVALGQTKPVALAVLESLMSKFEMDNLRKIDRDGFPCIYIDNPERPSRILRKPDSSTPWRLRLSGRPVNSRGKKEAAFKADGREIDLPSTLWRDYAGRHRHGVRPELREGDLVWLETRNGSVASAGDVVSIQWARWGRKGRPLSKLLPPEVLPDYMRDDGKVDEVTNLFGQVSPRRESACPAFAGRIRPDNLVFRDSVRNLMQDVVLAPLAQPHPGCMAFYRDTDDPGEDAKGMMVRGYKVYRTTDEPGVWAFKTQGVYNEQGQVQDGSNSSVNKTVDLLPKGRTGRLCLSFRSLCKRELAMLLQACEVPWRLGGGKPLGLGCCLVKVVRLLDERGRPLELPFKWQSLVADLAAGVAFWRASQQPVPKMRYPRAVEANNKRKQRGGHVWFKRHASPKKNPDSSVKGLEAMHLGESLKKKAGQGALPGQPLPLFDPNAPQEDLLYGYDLIISASTDEGSNRTIVNAIVPFDPNSHVTGRESSSGHHSQDRQTRQEQKAGRTEPAQPVRPQATPATAPPKPTLAKGMTADFVVCEDPMGKGRLWVKHESSGRNGNVMNPQDVPPDLKSIGARLSLVVFVYKPGQLQLKWQPAAIRPK